MYIHSYVRMRICIYVCMYVFWHSVSAVITANKGNDNALANKTKQVKPLGDPLS